MSYVRCFDYDKNNAKVAIFFELEKYKVSKWL